MVTFLPSRLLLEAQPIEHPADRRLLGSVAGHPERSRDEEPIPGARHRDVVEAETLGTLGMVVVLLDVAVGLRADPRPGRRMRDLEAEAPVGEREDVRDGRPGATRVGDHDDLELEALGRVDRHQPHRVGAFFLGHRIRLLGTDRLLTGDEPHEALEVGSAQLLVRPCQPPELAEVRVPPLAVWPSEHREVVVVLAEDALAELLEGHVRRQLEQAVVSLPEGEEQPPVALRQVAGEPALDTAEDRLPLRVRADEDQGVVRHSDERRGQHRQQRLVVVPVDQEAQIREQVDDLLLTEVVAARDPIGGQPHRAKLLLEPLGVRAGCEEHHDLAGCRVACVDELSNPARDVTRLGAAPVHAGLPGRLLVGDEQLDGVPERGRARALGRLEALELVAELRGEELVHRLEDLWP